MKYMNKFISCFIILLTVLMFQNCGIQPRLFQGRLLSSNEKSGNGGGYEGKTDGIYYHYIPGYTCEGSPSAEQITEIKDGQAYLYQNESKQCANQSAPISISDINISPLQEEFIGVKDSLFKRYNEKPAGIPNNLAEILCRDDFENPTFEIVSHYDREKNEALTRVYLPAQQISDFSVSRILSMNEVRYVSDKVSFKVDLSKAAFGERKFVGQIEKSAIAELPVKPLVCVIGGSIDTSKWSLKSLTAIDAGPFHLLKNNEIMLFSDVSRTYFSATSFRRVSHLFKIGLDSVVSDFSKMVLGNEYNIVYRIDHVDDNLSVFSAKLVSEVWPSMFVYDSRTGKTKKLTNLKAGADPEDFIMKTPALTADQYLFYDTQVIHFTERNTVVVRMLDFKDNSVTDVRALSMGSGGYSVLPKTNKLLLFWQMRNDVKNVIEIYDAATKTSTDLKIQIPDSCGLNFYDVVNFSDERAIVTTETCYGNKRNVIQVSLVNGSVKVLGEDSSINWSSEDNNRIIMTNVLKVNTGYDVRTGQFTNLPIDPLFGNDGTAASSANFILSEFRSKVALANDRFLYGFGGHVDAPKMYQVDLFTGESAPICESAVGKKLFLGILPNQKVFVFTYDAALKIYRFYQAKSPTECARINEFPSEFPTVPKLMATNIGFGLLLGNMLSRDTASWTREAVFVPIDGRPPLKFNPNSNGNWEMEVSADKNRIVLRGPDANNILRIFSFDL